MPKSRFLAEKPPILHYFHKPVAAKSAKLTKTLYGLAFSEASRGRAGDFLERAVKRANALKAAGQRDFGQREGGRANQRGGAVDAVLIDQRFEIHRKAFAEQPRQIPVIVPERVRHADESDVLGVVFLDVIQNVAHERIAFCAARERSGGEKIRARGV